MLTAILPDPARLWRLHPQELMLAGGILLAAAGSFAGPGLASSTVAAARPVPAGQMSADAAPPPLLVRQMNETDAVALNRQIPIVAGANPAAAAFTLAGADSSTVARAIDCLASAVYYEAGNEGIDGQRAVAQVVLNRVRHPAFPASVCDVVYQGSTRETGCQFTFTCDGSLLRRPTAEGWQRARRVAEAALNGAVFARVGNATHYHANYVVPYWASSLTKNAVEGVHIFYRWNGGWGQSAAFNQHYSRREPDTGQLRLAALAAEARTAKASTLAEGETPATIAVEGQLAELDTEPGDKRVALRFNPAARQAVEDALRERTSSSKSASDNLRWGLTGGSDQPKAEALGRKTAETPTTLQPALGTAAGSPQ